MWGALGAWLSAFAIVVAMVAGFQGFRGSVSDFAPASVSARDLKANGNARASGGAIDVRNTTDAPLTILRLPLRPFQAADLGQVKIDGGAVPRDVEIALLWIRRTAPGTIHEQRLPLDRARNVDVAFLDQNPEWRGEIAMVALGVKGQSTDAWRVARVTLEPVGAVAILRGVVTDWTAFDKWDGRSINVMFGGREAQRVYLPLLAFLAAVLAVAFMVVNGRRRSTRLVPAVLVVPFVIGWIAVDLRWSAELTAKARETWSAFAGRTLDERHTAMEDADLYRTISVAKSRLPGTPERIFINSDFDYFRMRAAYHFYPHNALAFGWYDGKVMRPGDLVFLYQKADVKFDASNNALIWPDGSRSAVVPVLAQTGAGLFRVQ